MTSSSPMLIHHLFFLDRECYSGYYILFYSILRKTFGFIHFTTLHHKTMCNALVSSISQSSHTRLASKKHARSSRRQTLRNPSGRFTASSVIYPFSRFYNYPVSILRSWPLTDRNLRLPYTTRPANRAHQ